MAGKRAADISKPGMTDKGWPRSTIRWHRSKITTWNRVLCRQMQGRDMAGLDLFEECDSGVRRVVPIFRDWYGPGDAEALFEAATFLTLQRLSTATDTKGDGSGSRRPGPAGRVAR